MLQIDDTLVSLDLMERTFACDLALCRGACCIEGDSGAPLEKAEFDTLQHLLPALWDDLSPAAQDVVRRSGIAFIDVEGDVVTTLVDGRDCIFACRDADGICRCTIEKACRQGRIPFLKPVSCHLYPVRVTRYKTFTAVNYNRWKICRAAETAGNRLHLPLYRFLREPLVRRFGAAWYEQLDFCAGEYLKQKQQTAHP
ncbi:MAG: DUF3109 family protein [Tannerella sp.]|nr:DUF3109 family protein [Tannerella sp.]